MVKERHENRLTTIITFGASDINKLQCLIGFEVWWLESKSSFFIYKKRPIPTRVPVACTHLQWSGWVIFKRTPNNSIPLWWRIAVSGIHTLRHNWLAQVWSLLKQYFFKLSNRRTILAEFSAKSNDHTWRVPLFIPTTLDKHWLLPLRHWQGQISEIVPLIFACVQDQLAIIEFEGAPLGFSVRATVWYRRVCLTVSWVITLWWQIFQLNTLKKAIKLYYIFLLCIEK